jgi:membrane-associated phospholipid phosphatase
MRRICPILSIVAICGIASPLAAQEASSIDGPKTTPITPVITAGTYSLSTPDTPAEAGAPALNADATALAFGQIGKPAPAPPTPEHTGIKATLRDLVTDVEHLPSKENLFWAGLGGGLALATHPLDTTANDDLSSPFLNKFFTPGAIMGQSYTLFPVAVTIYAVGRATDDKRLSHMGSDLVQALAVAEFITVSLKYTVRRERPDGSGANSFPSGHAADTMAFATALERHYNWHYYLPAYAFASYVAMSRLHDNVHFVSDVVFGSAVGIIAGRTVTRTGHRPFPVQAMALPGGFAIMYTRNGN